MLISGFCGAFSDSTTWLSNEYVVVDREKGVFELEEENVYFIIHKFVDKICFVMKI